jgi:chromosomal replication initiator protein
VLRGKRISPVGSGRIIWTRNARTTRSTTSEKHLHAVMIARRRVGTRSAGRSILSGRNRGAPVEDQLGQIWTNVENALRAAVPEEVYATWLKPLHPAGFSDGILYLEAPNRKGEWIERRFGGLLEAAASADEAVRRIEVTSGSETPARRETASELKSSYTFESFVIAGGNRFAHAAGLIVAELPGQAYNPLFICGGAGVGKTHLAQAIGNYVTLCVQGLAVRYATAETFTSEFMAALQRSDLPAFKKRYRQVDVLLLEDVQFLEGKDKTAEEFFYTVDSIINSGAQLVLSADRPPSAMPLLHSRLKERFESGLLVDIAAPDPVLKLAVLRKRCGPEADELTRSGVLDLLAQRTSSNVRSLESALIRSRAFASLTQQPLTLSLVEQVLGAVQPHEKTSMSGGTPTSIDEIQQRISTVLGLPQRDLLSPRRNRRLVYARQVAMYLCRELTDHSLPAIAQQFGGRDHTTVLHAHRKIQRELLTDSSTKDLVDKLVEGLHSP